MFQACDEEVEESETNFLVLVQTLLKDAAEREHFFQVRCSYITLHYNITLFVI